MSVTDAPQAAPNSPHIPVLLRPILDHCSPISGIWLDGTFGAGGYTRALLDSVLTPDPNMGIPNNQLGASYPNPIDPPTGCSFHPRCVNAMSHCATIAPNGKADGGHYVECHLYDDAS